MIGVTGATGRLGQALLARFPDALPIGRHMPSEKVSVLIHAAAPNSHDTVTVSNFRRYIMAVAEYADRWDPKIINIGSCWQILQGECYRTPYADLKREQAAIFPDAVHVIPYWVYGPSKGFLYQVRQALQGHGKVTTAGRQLRDFVHVDDVARHVEIALDLEPGRYASCSLQPIEPIAVLHKAGLKGTVVEPYPDAQLAYPLPVIGPVNMTVWDYLGV